MQKLENQECYLLGFKNAFEKELENEKDDSLCSWSIHAYESYINGYKDGITLKNTLSESARSPQAITLKITKETK